MHLQSSDSYVVNTLLNPKYLQSKGGMFRRFLPLFWSHQKPNEENVEPTSDDFRERSSSDPAPQAQYIY
jgi:hypothetical protein